MKLMLYYEQMLASESTTDADGGFVFDAGVSGGEYKIFNGDNSVLASVKYRVDKAIEVRMWPTTGDQMPPFRYFDFDENKEVDLKDLKDKVLVLDFVEAQCGPCDEAVQQQFSTLQKNPDWGEHVKIIAIATDSDRAAAEMKWKGMKDHAVGYGWASGKDGAHSGLDVLDAIGAPVIIIVSPEGQILKRSSNEAENIAPVVEPWAKRLAVNKAQ
ncbi:hypothetical protein BH09SUM1_BH09SUM1_19160 [soil metagenome]